MSLSYRLALIFSLFVVFTACSKNMAVNVRPPECTVDEKSSDCSTAPRQPSDMTEEPFFKDKAQQ